MTEVGPTRRDLLEWIGSAPFIALLASCVGEPHPAEWTGPPRGELIDVHCHVFNASDLPAVRFLKIVFLEMYPRQAISVMDVHDPDLVDGLLALLTWILGRSKAPTAKREVSLLSAEGRIKPIKQVASEQAQAVQLAVAGYVAAHTGPIAAAGTPESVGERRIMEALTAAASDRGPIGAASGKPVRQSPAITARKAYESKTDLGTYLRWFGLITHYRYALIDQLAQDHVRQGFQPKLIVPALVDYDKWLDQDVQSPLRDQVDVLDLLAQRQSGPAVHGYVAFDPLRQAYWDASVEGAGFDPLGLVKTAIKDKGFLGVKLYPPMGFKPIGNADAAQSYPKRVLDDLKQPVGPKLDAALSQLYSLCARMDAPILAHANRSNGAGPDYADRADPAFWLPVFDRWPDLRVCLAHFGHFSSPSVGGAGTAMPEASWEWTLGRYIAGQPRRHIYADISYMAEVFGKPEDLARTAASIRGFVTNFDPDVRHLMFGTDWIMLGMEAQYGTYTGRIHDFFEKECGFSADQMERLFHGNAERFLGLTRGSQTWSRLTAYYVRNGLSAGRLQALRGKNS